MEETYLSIKQLATRIGKSEQTITDYCNEGKFPNASRPGGGKWAIPESDVVAFMSGKPVAKPIAPIEESEAVRKAKEATAIAQENFKRTEQETNAKLIEKGWKQIEDGLNYIEERKKGLEEEYKKLEKEKSEFGNEVLKCKRHVEESNEHRLISVEMKKQAEAKYSRAVIMIKDADEKIKVAETEIKSLQDSIIYYDTYIEPILKNLKSVKNAVYVEAEVWQKNESLWKLFKYVTGKIVLLEKLLDNIKNATIPDALKVPEEEQPEVVEALPDETQSVELVETDDMENE